MSDLLLFLLIIVGGPIILILFFYIVFSTAFLSIISILPDKWNNSMEKDNLLRMLYKPPRTQKERVRYILTAAFLLAVGLMILLLALYYHKGLSANADNIFMIILFNIGIFLASARIIINLNKKDGSPEE